MTLLSVIVYAFCQLVIPVVVGSYLEKVYSGRGKLIFYWLSGQMVLWAGFQLLTVPMILKSGYFRYVQGGMLVFTVLLLLIRILLFLYRREWKIRVGVAELPREEQPGKRFRVLLLWVLAVGLLIFQLVMTIVYAYEEGDDAFYLALSTSTDDSGTMYRKIPYTGLATDLDMRHGLAPFPMWIALLGKMCGMHPISMAQIALPVALILMAYGVHYLMGQQLFAGDRENSLLFLVLVEVLTVFGGYSTYSVENFLLVRASQGKAVLCTLVLPFLLLLYMILFRAFQKNRRVHPGYWILHACVLIAGCLCSTQGGLLVVVLLAIVGLCIAVGYKQWKSLLWLGLSGVFPLGYMLLYMLLG